MLEVVYSFWDGSGHRRSIKIAKGTTIGKFLELVRQQLAPEFPELKGTHGDNLIYVKEDLMIPHVSFFEIQPFYSLYNVENLRFLCHKRVREIRKIAISNLKKCSFPPKNCFFFSTFRSTT